MADVPLVGPSYNLDSRPASVQRTINLVPVPQEPGNERTAWVLQDVPGLRRLEVEEGGGVVTGPVTTPLLLQFNGNALDSSGNGNDYVLGSVGPPPSYTFVSGRFGESIRNDLWGSPGASATTTPVLCAANEAFTVDFWLKHDSLPAGSDHALLGDEFGGGLRVVTHSNTTKIRMIFNSVFYTGVGSYDLSDLQWHYIRFTRGLAGALTLTVDGVVVATGTDTSPMTPASQRVAFWNGGAFFYRIDAYRWIRNKALSVGAHGIPINPPTVVTS